MRSVEDKENKDGNSTVFEEMVEKKLKLFSKSKAFKCLYIKMSLLAAASSGFVDKLQGPRFSGAVCSSRKSFSAPRSYYRSVTGMQEE